MKNQYYERVCKVCGRPMTVPIGTEQKYHKECRKQRKHYQPIIKR